MSTLPVSSGGSGTTFRRFLVEVVAGPGSGATFAAERRICTVGSQQANDLVIDDPTVSRYHCEISVVGDRFRVCDLGSRNGVRTGGVHIVDATVGSGAELGLGHTRIRVLATGDEAKIDVAVAPRFGPLIGNSQAMREVFAQLERAAAADATVLIEGETGTGKEGTAAALHSNSSRAEGPLVVVDCGAIPPNLIESELFGHEAGAFTGASSRRIGAFEEASGGTLFLDEIGELALELQPKLLRALESRQVRRVGSSASIDCDVRVVAATNRDLRAEVNDGRFRADLYYRLAVVRIELPPLRAREGDIELLARHLIAQLGGTDAEIAALTTTEFLTSLGRASWPGNVRELRNHLERCLVMQEASAPEAQTAQPNEIAIDPHLPYDEARRRAIESFERSYVKALVDEHDHNVAQAARAAGMNRAYLYRLLRRSGIERA